MKKLKQEQREALAGMDGRPGPSRMTDAYFDAVCPPDIAKKLKAERRSLSREIRAVETV